VLVREYIDTPKLELLTKHFENDIFGLTNILLAGDKRLSLKRLDEYFEIYSGPLRQDINIPSLRG